MSVLVKKHMDETNKNFWMGAGIGAVIIIIIDLLVPFMGPLLGGFVAGYIAKGDILNAGKSRISCRDSGSNCCIYCRICKVGVTSC